MSTVIDFAQTLHDAGLDVTKKGVDTLFGFATKLVDAQATLQDKVSEMAPKAPETLQKLTEPVQSFLGKPVDYAKWIEATDVEWDKLRRRYNVKLVDLVDALAPKAPAGKSA